TGRPRRNLRVLLDARFWILNTGPPPRRDLPECFGPCQTAYEHFNTWSKNGLFERILERLHLRLDEADLIDLELWCFDGTNVRAHASAEGGGKKGGFASPPTTP
ncbi:MAG: transposase, partial [Planctomycetota bacterium]|nr:transposase [Planctomycetota bacterium]